MTEPDRAPRLRDTLRRRIAPVAFLLALALLASRTCQSEAVRVRIELDPGAASAEVRAVRVDVFRQGEDQSVAVFSRRYGEAGPDARPSFEAQLDPGTYELRIEVETPRGHRRLERTIEPRDASTVTIRLERELTPGD